MFCFVVVTLVGELTLRDIHLLRPRRVDLSTK